MVEALEKVKVPAKLVRVEGAGHGFSQEQNQQQGAPAMLEWFEKYPAEKKEK
jgi:dipeptidyl aminopeptidase/acylaminoacyl peptidase